METYLVGGAVRDALLGCPTSDRDWVVVGTTPEAMVAGGYTPVGRDFPVFLHPKTKEEYALARTERKSGQGYRGFIVCADPSVTLEDDLRRRDFTVNAMAVPAYSVAADGSFDAALVIDPCGGRSDLAAQQLRHITSAFREDPVRILRAARFAARFPSFTLAPETLHLMQAMVTAGETDHLVAERVWQELSRGLMATHPARMLRLLRDCGALARLMPELDRLWGVPQSAEHHPEIDTGTHVELVMEVAAALEAPLAVRFACLVHDLGKGTTAVDILPRHIGHEGRGLRLLEQLCARLRISTDCQALAQVVTAEHGNIHRSLTLSADATLRLLERCDALRQPQRFLAALQACECDARGRAGWQDRPYPQRARLTLALESALAVDTAPIAAGAVAQGAKGPQIGAAIRAARLKTLAKALNPTA